jgi:hypothetical protein
VPEAEDVDAGAEVAVDPNVAGYETAGDEDADDDVADDDEAAVDEADVPPTPSK